MSEKASRAFEPRSLDSESRVLTVTPRGQLRPVRSQEKDAFESIWNWLLLCIDIIGNCVSSVILSTLLSLGVSLFARDLVCLFSSVSDESVRQSVRLSVLAVCSCCPFVLSALVVYSSVHRDFGMLACLLSCPGLSPCLFKVM